MADDDGDEWRFAVEDVGDDTDDVDDASGGEGADDVTGTDGDDYSVTMVGEDDDGPTVGVATGESEGEGGNVAGSLSPAEPVEPGMPEAENAAFVTAGALATILVFVSLVESDPVALAGVAVGVTVVAAALYAFFRRY